MPPIPGAFAGRARRSKASGVAGELRKCLTKAQVLDLGLRPNREHAGRFPPMGEDDPDTGLLALVRAECKRLRLGYYHTGIAVGSDAGYPDLTIWGPGEPRVIFPELKGSNGETRIRVRQLEVIRSMQAVGLVATFWWPEDYHLGIITSVLEKLAGVPERDRAAVLRPGYRRCGCHMDADHHCDLFGNYQPIVAPQT